MATSGTTGTPKVIELTTGQLVFSAMGSAMRLGHLPGDRWLGVLPLHHVGGLSIVMRCLLSASTVELHARFEVERVVEALCSARHADLAGADDARPHRPAFAPAGRLGSPPGRFRGGLSRPGVARSSARQGAPRGGHLGDERDRLAGCDLGAGRGADVCASATVPRGALRSRPVGRARAWPLEAPCSPTIAAPSMGSGVRVDGRLDQTIISGGENIDPEAIAAVLRQHPDVLRAYVVGVPDSVYGERPAAALIAGGDRQPSAQELRAFA